MKTKVALVGVFILLVASNSFAQITINGQSEIIPEQSERFINPWSVLYEQNTRTGELLVVWYDWNSDGASPALTGRIVDAKGISVGKEFTIASNTQNPIDSFNCCYGDKLAYNPITNQYLVTYSEGHEDASGQFGKIIAVRLASNGKRKGKAVDLTSRFPDRVSFDNKPTNLKFNPVSKGFLEFSYRHTIPATTTTVGFFEQITRKGTPDKSPQMTNWLWPKDFVFLPSGKILMSRVDLVQARHNFGGDYQIAVEDPSKQNELKDVAPGEWTVVGRVTKHLLLGGPVLEMVSSDSPIVYFTDNANVKGRKITSEGKPSGSSFSALNAPAKKKRLLVSSVVFSSTPTGTVGLLIALDDEGYPNGSVSVWAQRLNDQGKPVGNSKKLFTTSENERIEANKLFALSVQPGENVARFVWLAQNSDFFNNQHKVLKYDLSTPLP